MKCVLVHPLLLGSSDFTANMYFGSGVSPVTTFVWPLSARGVHPSVAECGL